MYNKIIKQTAKPVVLVQNMLRLNLLLFQVNFVLSRIKDTINIIKLTDGKCLLVKIHNIRPAKLLFFFLSSKRQ